MEGNKVFIYKKQVGEVALVESRLCKLIKLINR